MSDSVMAAIIAATATLFASFLQLRAALARNADAQSRGQTLSRRRTRLPMMLISIMLLASAVGGFALSRWLNDSDRNAQSELQRELKDRLADVMLALSRLEALNSSATLAQQPAQPGAELAVGEGSSVVALPESDTATAADSGAAASVAPSAGMGGAVMSPAPEGPKAGAAPAAHDAKAVPSLLSAAQAP